MSTHNMFLWRNKKRISTFRFIKTPYLELCSYVNHFGDGYYISFPLAVLMPYSKTVKYKPVIMSPQNVFELL